MNKFFSFLVFLFISSNLLASGPTPLFVSAEKSDNFKLLFIPKTSKPPLIDGYLNDDVWKKAVMIDDFGPCAYGARRYSFPKTEVRYLWDNDYLYVGITCYEDSEENMERHNLQVENKSEPIYSRDCVELHIDGNNDNATRFQIWFIDTEEKMIFWHYDFGWGILVNEDYGLSADWDYKAIRGKNFWQIEGKISLSDVQIKPKAGYIFGMNPCRFRFNKIEKRDDGFISKHVTQFLSWSTQGGDHHDPRKYGKCILVEKKPDSIEAGLKLAFPDLNKRKILIQTKYGFDVFDRGKHYKTTYPGKLKEELKPVNYLCEKLNSIINKDVIKKYKYLTKQAEKYIQENTEIKKEINSLKNVSVASFNDYRKKISHVSENINRIYWQMKRILLLSGEEFPKEEKIKFEKKYHSGRDEPENYPDPDKRKIPYIPWAKNFVSGKIKTLIITDEGSSWDAYELKKRMDIDAEIYYCTGHFPPSIGPKTDYYKEGILLYPEKKKQLEYLLKNNYDAIIFLGFSPRYLPSDIQYQITENLLNGTSIFVFQASDWDFPGLKNKFENDSELRKTIPYKHMTKLIPYKWEFGHRGEVIDTLERKVIKLEVPPVKKLKVGKGWYCSFQPGGGGYFFKSALSPHTQQEMDKLFQAEYYYALAPKIILKYTGKFTSLIEEIECENYKPENAVLKLNKNFRGILKITVRNKWGKIIEESRGTVNIKNKKVSLKIPPLPAGDYYIDVSLYKGTKLYDWASQRFKVKGGIITGVSLKKKTYKEGENLYAKVSVKNTNENFLLKAELRDVNGRIIQKKEGVEIKNGTGEVIIPLKYITSTYNKLDFSLYNEEGIQDIKSIPVFIIKKKFDNFTVFTDGSGKNRYGFLRHQILKNYGINLMEVNGNPFDIYSSGIDIVKRYWLTHSSNETGGSIASEIYHKGLSKTLKTISHIVSENGGRLISLGDDSGVIYDFTNNYPNWVLPLIKLFSEKYPPKLNTIYFSLYVPRDFYKKRGLPYYGEYWRWLWRTNHKELVNMKLQPGDFELFIKAFKEAYPDIQQFNRANGTSFKSFDEIKPSDLKKINPGFVPDVIGFQDYLKQKYRSIEKLNKIWGCSVKSFEEIKPGVLIPDLLSKNKYAAQIDKCLYLENLYIKHMKTAGTAVHSVNPNLGVGQGASSFENIIPDVLKHIDTYAPYHDEINIEMARCFPHRYLGETLGVYGGKAVKVPSRIQQVWHVLFTGGNFIWFWSASTGGLMGDLTVNPNRSGAMLETIKFIKNSGIAAAILKAKRQHNGIAILHSRLSGIMSGIVKEMGTQRNSEGAFQFIIEDLGMQYDYITTEQIEKGILQKSKYKVLLLPYTQILTEKEVKEIKEFVKRGGNVIADLRTGSFSVEGKPLKKGTLDDLFGIRREKIYSQPVRGILKVNFENAKCSIDGFQADSSIVNTSGIPAGKIKNVPVLISNKYGKGKCIFLNLGISAYRFLLNKNKLGKGRKLFLKIFEECGVKPEISVEKENGKSIPGVEFAIFERGKVKILTAEKKSFSFEKYPIKGIIKLDKKYYIYNMKNKKYLGYKDKIPVEFTGLGCYVWALLPYRVNGLSFRIPRSVKKGSLLNVDLRIKVKNTEKISPHIILFNVISPAGKLIYNDKIDMTKKEISYKIPVAYNEQKGKWALEIKDVYSGITKKLNYLVK